MVRVKEKNEERHSVNWLQKSCTTNANRTSKNERMMYFYTQCLDVNKWARKTSDVWEIEKY